MLCACILGADALFNNAFFAARDYEFMVLDDILTSGKLKKDTLTYLTEYVEYIENRNDQLNQALLQDVDER